MPGFKLFGTPKPDVTVAPNVTVAPDAPDATVIVKPTVAPESAALVTEPAVTAEQFGQVMASLKNLTEQVAAQSVVTTNLTDSLAKEKSDNKIFSMAVSAGSSITEAKKLVTMDISESQKLETIIAASAAFKQDALNTLQASPPVGSGDQAIDLNPILTVDANVKTTSQAVSAVMTQFGISGPSAVAKAKLMYPKVYADRAETPYGKLNKTQLK